MHEVRYEPLTTYGGQIQRMTLITTVVGNATLTGLQEYTEYNISVRAYTSVGPGPYSEEVTNRTVEDGEAIIPNTDCNSHFLFSRPFICSCTVSSITLLF